MEIPVELHVAPHDGVTMSFDVNPTDTVAILKTKIEVATILKLSSYYLDDPCGLGRLLKLVEFSGKGHSRDLTAAPHVG